MTAETAIRIDQLYSASVSLNSRSERHWDEGNPAKARRARRASGRLQLAAYMLLMQQLTHAQQSRLVSIRNAQLVKKTAV